MSRPIIDIAGDLPEHMLNVDSHSYFNIDSLSEALDLDVLNDKKMA